MNDNPIQDTHDHPFPHPSTWLSCTKDNGGGIVGAVGHLRALMFWQSSPLLTPEASKV